MNAVEQMRTLKDKNFSQRSNIEKCIVLAWEDNQSESIALRAAEENAKNAVVAAQRDALLAAAITAERFISHVYNIEDDKDIELPELDELRAAIAATESDGAK